MQTSRGKQPKMITIEEDYFDFRGQCYYAWRVEGAKDWNFKPTGHTERPYIRWKKLNEAEYAGRLRRYELAPPKQEVDKK